MHGQDFVGPENVRAVAHPCLRHRVHLSYDAEADGKTTNDVIDAILERVAAV